MVVDKYDLEADVVVVGYGGAGAAAAIAAHDNGAKVVLLEKMPTGGGNTQVSGGTIFNPTGIGAVEYIETLSYGTVDREMIQTFVENAMGNGEWLQSLGGETEFHWPTVIGYPFSVGGAAYPKVREAKSIAKIVIKGTDADGSNAQRLWKVLSSSIERRGIEVMLSTPARDLITNGDGEVTGVVADKDGNTLNIKASKGVVLTCGGFEYNESMKWDFLPCKPLHCYGNPGNTGDGIRMAQKIGAGLWHMTALSAQLGFKTAEYQAAFPVRFLSEGFIYVDKTGRRFVNEVAHETHDMWRAVSLFDPESLDYPRIPMQAIFDETTRRRGPLWIGGMGVNRDLYDWSLDNSKEISKGWITRAKTIGELAKKISAEESTLKDTIAQYNQYCELGRDADFDRRKETMRPLEGPPYYAMQLWPCLINTQGGPPRDKEARVLDPEGKPIRRLYSAGELGSLWGFVYQGSGNVGECLVFGRIAGRNAASEEPWS